MNKFLLLPVLLLALNGCKGNEPEYDASGTFEATETIISAQANGQIEALDIHEGQHLDSSQVVGYVDSAALHLKREQLQAQITAILGKRPDASAQVAALQAKLQHAEEEQKRLSRLVKADAATTKQLDDANAQIAVLKKQIAAQQSSLNITSSSLHKETLPLTIELKELDDQLEKCKIINPVTGIVLTKYAETHEMTAAGKPLYTIADLSTIILRAYITGNQLNAIKPGQQVKVFVDSNDGKTKAYKGTVEWISDKAEFTPKTIQTKEERANLVYAIKVRVKNDGTLKIGMYGAVQLTMFSAR
jgi:HlyD family secretion protein